MGDSSWNINWPLTVLFMVLFLWAVSVSFYNGYLIKCLKDIGVRCFLGIKISPDLVFFARWKRVGGPNNSYHIRVGSDPNLLSKLTGAHSCLLSLSVFSLADVDTNLRTCKLTKLLIWANMISGVFPEALRLSVITYLLSFASRVSSNKNVSLHFMIFLGEQWFKLN